MSKISFFVFGEPRPQPRQKVSAFRYKDKTTGETKFSARTYNPGTAEHWKGCISEAAKTHRPQVPMDGPLQVNETFFVTRPDGHFVAGDRAKGLKKNAPRWHAQSFDRDNLDKAVLDALGYLGFFRNDAQVCFGRLAVLWTPFNAPSGCLISLEHLDDSLAEMVLIPTKEKVDPGQLELEVLQAVIRGGNQPQPAIPLKP